MTAKIAFDRREGYETQASVKRRIAQTTGFQYSKIVLMEGSLNEDRIYTDISFQVNGHGFWTDFINWGTAHQFDEGYGNEF